MTSHLVQVNWETRNKVLFSNINILRKKEIHTDVILCCDGQNFPAHRLVLSMSSGYFARAFEVNKGYQASLVLICGIKPTVLEDLISFIYEGTTTIRSKDIPDLLKAGLQLEIPGLMEMGTTYIAEDSLTEPLEPAQDFTVFSARKNEKNYSPKGFSPLKNEKNDSSSVFSARKNLNDDFHHSEQRSSSSTESSLYIALKQSSLPGESQFHSKEQSSGSSVNFNLESGSENKLLDSTEHDVVANASAEMEHEAHLSSEEAEVEDQHSFTTQSLLFDDSSLSQDTEYFEGWESKEPTQLVAKKITMKGCKKSQRCHICNKGFYKRKSLSLHLQNHKNPVTYSCKHCATKFRDQRIYKLHMNTHIPDKIVKKSKRNVKSTYKSFMEELKSSNKRRKKTVTPPANGSIDDVLKTVSKSLEALSNNVPSYISDDRMYDYDVNVDMKNINSTAVSETEDLNIPKASRLSDLSKVSSEDTKNSLQLIQSVASVRTKHCIYCNIEFLHTRSYRKHRTTDCKVLECKFCLSNFQLEEKEIYQEHVETHVGVPKPYLCPQCQYCTDSNRSFEDHVSLHTGQYRHSCPLCPFQARRLNDIRNHSSKEHPQESETDLVENQLEDTDSNEELNQDE